MVSCLFAFANVAEAFIVTSVMVVLEFNVTVFPLHITTLSPLPGGPAFGPAEPPQAMDGVVCQVDVLFQFPVALE